MSTFPPAETGRAYEARTVEQLAAAIRGGDKPDWLMFWGHRPEPDGQIDISCLSQWYPAAFTVEGIAYPTAEHFIMSAKARVFQDADAEASILSAATAGEAKELGRRVRGFAEITWTRHREMAVLVGNVAKFHQNPGLGDFLAATGTRVQVEASPYDRIWGIGLRASDRAPPTRTCGRDGTCWGSRSCRCAHTWSCRGPGLGACSVTLRAFSTWRRAGPREPLTAGDGSTTGRSRRKGRSR